MKIAVLVLAVCLGAFAQDAKQVLSARDQQLVDNSRAVLEAQKAKNPASLLALVTADFVQIGSEGASHRRNELVDDAREGHLKDYYVYDVHVVQVDDESAIVTYNAIISALEGDDVPVPRYQLISDLWVKQGDAWKLKFEQATPLRHVD